MSSLRGKEIPIIITAVAGLLSLAAFFFDIPLVRSSGEGVGQWAVVIAAFAIGIGAINNLLYHAQRVIKREKEWFLNGWAILVFVLTTLLGLQGIDTPTYQWIYQNVLLPLGATVVCLMGFYNLQAAVYAFRLSTVDSALMFIASLIVFMYNVPIGIQIFGPNYPTLGLWIIQIWQGMGSRVYHMVGTLGTVSIGLRVLFMGYGTGGVGTSVIKKVAEE